MEPAVHEGRVSDTHLLHLQPLGPSMPAGSSCPFRVLVSYQGQPWVHSSVARPADCRSARPWLKSGCALLSAGAGQSLSDQPRHIPSVSHRLTWISNPVTRNQTRDHLMAALIYSQMICQLSYDRLVLLRPQPMSTSTSSMCPSYLLPDASPRHARLPDFRRPHPRLGWRQVWPMFLCKPWDMVDIFFGECLCNRIAGASRCRTRTWCIGSFPSGQAAPR